MTVAHTFVKYVRMKLLVINRIASCLGPDSSWFTATRPRAAASATIGKAHAEMHESATTDGSTAKVYAFVIPKTTSSDALGAIDMQRLRIRAAGLNANL